MERVAEAAKQHEPSPAMAGHGRGASPAAASLPPALELQQLAGNQAVQELLRSGYIQAKLAISNPDDPEEREADNVAHTIMRKAAAAPASAPCSCAGSGEMCEECQQKQSAPAIQRRASAPAAPAHVPRIVGDVLRSSGHPLDASTRAFFEPRFGHDFRHVRIHTDAPAAESARSINAHAYTAGSDVVFASGQYSPATDTGRSLLAHELVHVLQQAPLSSGLTQVENSGGPQQDLLQPNGFRGLIRRQSSPGASEVEPETTAARTERSQSQDEPKGNEGRMSFEELRSLDPAFAQAVANLSQSYRALIRQIDPVLERAGVYDKPTLENLLQRTARQIVFAYEDEITQANFYDSVHLSTWLERVTSALGYLGPLLQSLRAGGGRNATLAERADTRRQQLLRDSRDLESMRFIREGKSSREKRAARELEEQRIAASVDFIRDFLRRVWQPNLSDQEGRLYGTVLVEHLVQRKHLNADEIREVLDRLRDEDPRLLRAALFRGGTVQALLAVGIGGLQAYRAEGEGFFAGAIRAERENVIAHPLGERVFSTGERVIAVLGFIAGVFQGIGDDIISNVKGIVELFTPSFWHGMRDFFRSFLPQFIDNEDFRFQLGQMMGKFSVDEERRLATADPFEYGLSFGHVFGMALVEIVLTFVGLGFVLKALRGSERLKRIARPLVALAKAIGRTALAARGLRFAQALGEAINALSRRLRRLTMLLPDLTPNARLRRTLFEMEEADRELQAAARRAHELEKLAREALAAGDEEAAQRHVKDLSEAADDLEGRVGGETPKPAEPVPEPAKPAAGVTGIPKEVEEDIADHFAHKYDAVSRELIKQVLDAYMGDSKVLFHVLEAWESESPKKAVHLATDTLGVARDLSHIEGIGIVFEDLASSSSRTARGAQFELKWILEHKNEVIRVAVPSATSPRFELKGLDVLTTGGSVELKDFNLASKFYSEAPELAAERVARQVERRVLEGDTKVHVVFSSDSGPMPAALKNALETRLNAVAQAHGLSPGALSFSLWP